MGRKPIIRIRETVKTDAPWIEKWLMEPGILEGFPMIDKREIDDAVRVWMQYVGKGMAITALYKKEPCGAGNLYIQPIEKLKHQCLFVVVVDPKYQGQGIGTLLIRMLERRAKERFKIELLHLEVYEGNRAIRLYERLGFVYYGEHPGFLKDSAGNYLGKVLMQKSLV
ncbi:MAG: GNAT family N-acetyltransferase [Chlamydiota bacterium]